HLRDEGANALLKVLEEPPGETVFFLLTQTPEVLLPTIRSRCQHFPFQPLQQDQVKKWLIAEKQYSVEQAALLAPFSHGSLGFALNLNAEQYGELREKILAVLEATFLPRSYHILFEAIRGISVERSEMGERLLILEELLRDLLVLKAATGASLVHED